MIRIIGLGVTDGDLSIRGAVAIDKATRIIVKTGLTDTYGFFSEYEHITCDDIYNTASDFEELDAKLVNRVMEYKDENTVYCVNGSGYDDRSVILMRKLYTDIEIIPSVSRDSSGLNIAPTTSYLSMSAYDIISNPVFDYDHSFELVIKDIDNDFAAAEVKTTLARVIGDETEITLLNANAVKTIALYELDREKEYNYLTTLVVPPLDFKTKQVYNYIDLIRILYILRGDNGCTWDREQTHESIRSNVVEEAYELVEAINNEDIDNIIEESGDVILQGAFHTIIGAEEGEFEQQEVLSTLCRKLITRHTHVFGADKANNAEEALKAWEAAKAKEKSTASFTSKILHIAKALPSLMRAEKTQKIASKAGLDFKARDEIEHKVLEELREYIKAEDKEDEGGDLLLSVVNLLRFDNIKCEIALNRAVQKFINRFAFIEKRCEDKSVEMQSLTAEELDKLWVEAKSNENR